MPQRLDTAPIRPAGAINLMIESPLEVIDHGLNVEFTEPREDFLPDIRDAIAIGILEVPDIGRCCYKNAPFPERQSCGPRDVLGEQLAGIKHAVAVGIAQHANLPQRQIARLVHKRLVGILVSEGVVSHLEHPALAMLVIFQRHG